MKIYLILAFLSLSFVMAFAAERTSTQAVEITLTAAQISAINAGGTSGATITFTTAQANLIKQTYPGLKSNTVKASTAQVRNSKLNIIVDAKGEANPQPSP